MVHRNVHFFTPKQTFIVNNNYNVRTNHHHHCCGGMNSMSIWSNPMMMMQTVGLFTNFAQDMATMFAGLRRAPVQQNYGPAPQELNTNADDTLKNLRTMFKDYTWGYDKTSGNFYGVDKDGNLIKGKTFEEIVDQIKPSKASKDPDSKSTQKTDGGGGSDALDEGDPITQKPTYEIEEKKSKQETVKTIPYGGPYHYALYYKDANGKQVSPGTPEFNIIMNMLKNQMGEVEGDRGHRIIPKEFTINGKTYSLMNAEERDKLGLRGESGGIDTRYGMQKTGSTYTVYEIKPDGNRTIIGEDLDKAAAEKLKADKENE